MIRSSYLAWREYFRQDFHPDRQHSELSRRWLQQNNTAHSIVGT
jgi:predicted metal-dependent hydrolase